MGDNGRPAGSKRNARQLTGLRREIIHSVTWSRAEFPLKHSGPSLAFRKAPKQARSAQLVEDVLEAAVLVLSKEGAKRFTTTRVADAAGVSVGSLYQYFPNKESILIRLQVDEWQTTALLLLGILEKHDQPPLDRIRAAVAAFLQSECEEAAIRTALAEEAPVFRESTETMGSRRAMFRRFLAFWREVLPHSSAKQRLQAINLVMTTVEAVGNQVSEKPRSLGEIAEWATELSEMLCAYLSMMQKRAG